MQLSTINAVKKYDLILVTAAFLLLVPLLTMQRTTDFMIFCVFVLAYDLIYGYMGRLSFGHMLYLGVGAYAAALSAEHLSGNPFLALLIAIAAGALVGLLLGPIIVRTTGACFALINLAFNQVGYFLVLIALSEWTGGEDGMSAFYDPVWIFDFGDRKVMFVFTLMSLVFVVYLVRRLTSSPFGILLRTIKENETRAKFLGYNTFLYKLLAFILSTSLAAFAGALTMLNYTYATPSFIDPTRNVEVIFACLIGGAGNVYGALVGGVGYMILSNYLPNYIQRWEMFLGFALLVLVFKFQAGLWGYFRMLITARKREV
ncbi:MAG: branched-chain amino acid ABC transporter permease [Spirochaetales bacterium]|jgi:branched-chain amino acid transport system permease protein|nr:branched-chain amino acid ABC transporter permease [Spirochaetales bacterium]